MDVFWVVVVSVVVIIAIAIYMMPKTVASTQAGLTQPSPDPLDPSTWTTESLKPVPIEDLKKYPAIRDCSIAPATPRSTVIFLLEHRQENESTGHHLAFLLFDLALQSTDFLPVPPILMKYLGSKEGGMSSRKFLRRCGQSSFGHFFFKWVFVVIATIVALAAVAVFAYYGFSLYYTAGTRTQFSSLFATSPVFLLPSITASRLLFSLSPDHVYWRLMFRRI